MELKQETDVFIAEPRTMTDRKFLDFFALNFQNACAGLLHQPEEMQQGRFARARGPEDRYDFPFPSNSVVRFRAGLQSLGQFLRETFDQALRAEIVIWRQALPGSAAGANSGRANHSGWPGRDPSGWLSRPDKGLTRGPDRRRKALRFQWWNLPVGSEACRRSKRRRAA